MICIRTYRLFLIKKESLQSNKKIFSIEEGGGITKENNKMVNKHIKDAQLC